MKYAIEILEERLDITNYQMEKMKSMIGSSVYAKFIKLKIELTEAISLLKTGNKK